VGRDLIPRWTWGRNTVHVAGERATASSTPGAVARLALITVCALVCALLFAGAATAAAPTLTGTFDGTGTPAGDMSAGRPAVDEATGDVYVIDKVNHVVDRFSATGTYLGQLTGVGTTAGDLGIQGNEDDVAVDNSGGPLQGYVYVVGEQSGGPGILTAFDASGRFVWQRSGDYPPPNDLCGVAVDSAGNLWTGDQNNGFQQRSVVDGSLMGSLVTSTLGPCHMAFDSTGIFYVIRLGGNLRQYAPNIAADSPVVFDFGPIPDVAVDSATNEVYSDHGSSIAVFDSADNPIAETPFDSGDLSGVTVDGAHATIFVTNAAAPHNQVEIWARAGGGGSRPYVRAGAPTGVSGTGATLNARVNPAGDATTTCRFEYGTTTAYGSSVNCDSAPGSGTSDVDATATVGSLTPLTTYHYRIVATNGAGTVRGADNTFDAVPTHRLRVIVGGTGSGRVDDGVQIIGCTSSGGACEGVYAEGTVVPLTATPANSTISWSGGGCSGSSTSCDVTMSADQTVTVTFDQRTPTVVPASATDITQTTATLNSTANPQGAATTCEFEYGTTTGYGTRAPAATNPGSGTSAVAVRAPISGLTPSTDYHYRLDCANAGGATNGSDQTFRTLPIPPPTATTGAASGVAETTATLAGSVTPNGWVTTCRFEYGTSTAYGSSVDCAAAPGSGPSAIGASAAIAGLAPGTTYHYRIVASNGGGTTNGGDATFATATPRNCVTDPSLCNVTVTVTSAKAVISGSTAKVPVSCTGDVGGVCRGTAVFKATVKTKVKKGRKTVVKRRTITVGSAAFDLAAGTKATLSVKLTSAAKSALKKGKLVAKAEGLTRPASVTFPKIATPRRHKKKH
jgi:phosphodiesterase/alkaline phosphatase D-like protein